MLSGAETRLQQTVRKKPEGENLPALMSAWENRIPSGPVKRELRADFPREERHQFVLKRTGPGESVFENPIRLQLQEAVSFFNTLLYERGVADLDPVHALFSLPLPGIPYAADNRLKGAIVRHGKRLGLSESPAGGDAVRVVRSDAICLREPLEPTVS